MPSVRIRLSWILFSQYIFFSIKFSINLNIKKKRFCFSSYFFNGNNKSSLIVLERLAGLDPILVFIASGLKLCFASALDFVPFDALFSVASACAKGYDLVLMDNTKIGKSALKLG